jgi:hypothetical protein
VIYLIALTIASIVLTVYIALSICYALLLAAFDLVKEIFSSKPAKGITKGD